MTTEYDYSDYHYPNGFNLSKHPTCDSARRERRRMEQLYTQPHMEHELSMMQTQQHHTATTTTHAMMSSVATLHDAKYYWSCYLAGGLSSSIRWILSPLELVKTRLQTASIATTTAPVVVPAMTPNFTFAGARGVALTSFSATATTTTTMNPSMLGTFVHIYTHEGTSGLFRGVGPTAVAYWLQTSTKYTLYEMIKDRLTTHHTAGDTNTTMNAWNRGLIYVAAAASAEAIADVLMCPFEMLKVKMQTAVATTTGTTTNHSMYRSTNTTTTSFPNQFVPALKEMIQNRTMYNFPFGSLGPVWGRQIPGTIVNFFTFENAVSMIYNSMGEYEKSAYTPTQQLGVTVLAGYIAGVCCAIVSHPADSIISLRSLPEHQGQSIRQIVQRVGWYRLATKGLGPRIIMTGQIIAFQWLLYDSFKSMFGYGTSGGGK
jgi:solute carrier family 25 (mitochondrial phosphate transporter), member 3